MVQETNSVSRWMWIIISAVLLIIVGVSVIVLDVVKTPEIVLSTWLVIGVIALLVALSFTAVIFKTLGLANTTHALGLPEGSIRATIALSLILIFIMSSIFLYWQVSTGKEFVSRGVTKGQIDAMPQEEIVQIVLVGVGPDNETLYDVTRIVEKNNVAGVDIAKQIITTVSTLVVAIAGFYFGTQAVAVAKGTGEVPAPPAINGVEPAKGEKGQEIKEFKIFGKNLGLTKEVELKGPGTPINCLDINPNPEMVTCALKIPDDAVPGKWTVVVKFSDQGEVQLENIFEVVEKTA